MDLNLGGFPYITQITLQESKHVGGLDRIVLGGQGETAEAAHEAMSSFPEPSQAQKASPEAMTGFIQEYFHPSWTETSQLKLAGFVGMHAQGGQVTRDAKNLGIASKLPGVKTIGTTIVTNTPHKFIQGGYKVQTTTWDGRRIDDFAGFLADIGIFRYQESTGTNNGGSGFEQLTPRDRSGSQQGSSKEVDAKEQLSDVQKHALLVMKEKKATEQTRNKILQRIEADKVERKIKQERQRQARLAREEKLRVESQSDPSNGEVTQDATNYNISSPINSNASYSLEAEEWPKGSMADDDDLLPRGNARNLSQANTHAGVDSEWSPHGQIRGEMLASRMRALGVANEQDGDVSRDGQDIKEKLW